MTAPFVGRCRFCDAAPVGLYFFLKEADEQARVQALCRRHATLTASWDRYTLWRWTPVAPSPTAPAFPWDRGWR